LARFWATEWTWAPNSRVGTRIKTLVVGIAFGLYKRRSKIGMTKAAVLPEPVVAEPHISKPCIAIGIALAWMGVGFTNPKLEIPFKIGLERDIVVKVSVRSSLTSGAGAK